MVISFYPWLILAVLASFRLAEMFVIDDGPFDVFMYLRGWSLSNNALLRTIGGIFNCVHCAGVYTSLFFCLGYFWQNTFSIILLSTFAVAGMQSILAHYIGRS